MNKLWKKYDKLTGECYNQFISGKKSFDCWNQTFDVLVEAINNERENNKQFAKHFYEINDELDYEVDIDGWLEDYLDDLEVRNEFEREIETCKRIISLFEWETEDLSDFRLRISLALGALGRNDEALAFCEEWYQEEKDNIFAAVALVYSKLGVKDLHGAENIVNKFITETTKCNEENDIMFTAAAALYKINGNKKAAKRINEEIQRYEKEVEEYFMGEEEDDLEWDEDDLPFN